MGQWAERYLVGNEQGCYAKENAGVEGIVPSLQ